LDKDTNAGTVLAQLIALNRILAADSCASNGCSIIEVRKSNGYFGVGWIREEFVDDEDDDDDNGWWNVGGIGWGGGGGWWRKWCCWWWYALIKSLDSLSNKAICLRIVEFRGPRSCWTAKIQVKVIFALGMFFPFEELTHTQVDKYSDEVVSSK